MSILDHPYFDEDADDLYDFTNEDGAFNRPSTPPKRTQSPERTTITPGHETFHPMNRDGDDD